MGETIKNIRQHPVTIISKEPIFNYNGTPFHDVLSNSAWGENPYPDTYVEVFGEMAERALKPRIIITGIEIGEVTFTREVEVQKEVTKTREVETFDEDGNPITVTEEYTEMETVMEEQEYTMMTVTAMTEGTLPDPVPEPEPTAEESVWDELDKAYQEGVDGAYDE